MSVDTASASAYDCEILLEVEELDDTTEDLLYESHDVVVSSHGDVTRLIATVSAPTAVAAARSLLEQVAAAGAKPVRFVPDLVTRAEMALRAGVSRQAVSNWTRGERKAAFPSPLSGIAGGLWCYGDVVPWLIENVDDFDEPCRHPTWTEFSEFAPLASSGLTTPASFPGGAITDIVSSSQTDSPAALAHRIGAFIHYAASGGTGRRDPVNDLLEVIARDASVAQRSVIVDSLPTLLQESPRSRTDPDLEARALALSMYFANSLGSLATERDKVRIEKAIKAMLDLAVTRKEIPTVSALLASLAFSPYRAPTELLQRAIDLVGVPAYSDGFLALLATNPEAAVDWLMQPRDDHSETGIPAQEALGVLKYSIILMSKSRPRHVALAAHDDRGAAIRALFAPLIESIDIDRADADELLRIVGKVGSLATSIETEPHTALLDEREREQVEQFARYSNVGLEHWPPVPAE